MYFFRFCLQRKGGRKNFTRKNFPFFSLFFYFSFLRCCLERERERDGDLTTLPSLARRHFILLALLLLLLDFSSSFCEHHPLARELHRDPPGRRRPRRLRGPALEAIGDRPHRDERGPGGELEAQDDDFDKNCCRRSSGGGRGRTRVDGRRRVLRDLGGPVGSSQGRPDERAFYDLDSVDAAAAVLLVESCFSFGCCFPFLPLFLFFSSSFALLLLVLATAAGPFGRRGQRKSGGGGSSSGRMSRSGFLLFLFAQRRRWRNSSSNNSSCQRRVELRARDGPADRREVRRGDSRRDGRRGRRAAAAAAAAAVALGRATAPGATASTSGSLSRAPASPSRISALSALCPAVAPCRDSRALREASGNEAASRELAATRLARRRGSTSSGGSVEA